MHPESSSPSESTARRSRSRSRGKRIRRDWDVPRYTIYVLRLSEGKYYVGRTTKPLKERLEEHRSGRLAAVWSRKFGSIDLVESMRSGPGMTELSITKQYMAVYGIDNVRGSCYCRVMLSPGERQKLDLDIRQIRAQMNLCYHCGGRHFAAQCKQNNTLSRTSSNPTHFLTLKDLMSHKERSPITTKNMPVSTTGCSTSLESNSQTVPPSEELMDPVVSSFSLT